MQKKIANYFAFFMLLFLIIYSISILWRIVIDIFIIYQVFYADSEKKII